MPRPDETPPLNLPGGYRALRFLGRGAFGEVWQAEAPGGVEVAVKIIQRTLRPKEAEREQEAIQLIKSLRHPYLLALQAFFPLEDRLVMVLELAERNLSQRLEQCRSEGQVGIPPAELLGYFREAAEALDYLHEQNVQHRDIKPDNLLLVRRHVKVSDYGLARALEKYSLQSASSVGTPAYMAPEVWGAKVSPHSDQYSLAVAYVKLRADRLPFQADSFAQLCHAHLSTPPDLEGFGKPEATALGRALAKDPGQRHPTCSAFVDALTEALAQEPIIRAAAVEPIMAMLVEESTPVAKVMSQPTAGQEAKSSPHLVPEAVGTGSLDVTLGGEDAVESPTLKGSRPGQKSATARMADPARHKEWQGPRPSRRRRLVVGGAVVGALAVGLGLLAWKVLPLARDDGNAVPTSGELTAVDAGSLQAPSTGKAQETGTSSTGARVGEGTKKPPATGPGPQTGGVTGKTTPPGEKQGFTETLRLDLGRGVYLDLVRIDAGEFHMGAPDLESKARSNEKPRHLVRITKPFYLAKYPVTQEQYERLTGKANPSWFSPSGGGKAKVAGLETKRFPVEQVSWIEANDYCEQLRKKQLQQVPETLRNQGYSFRLPTEAQWEYASRAGTTTPFYFGSVLDGKHANCDGNFPYGTEKKGPYLERTERVDSGKYKPNAWGLYDMLGNVGQWCADYYGAGYYADSPIQDPPGPATGDHRVIRGGSWSSDARSCRSAYRTSHVPDTGYNNVGFRVAYSAAPRSP